MKNFSTLSELILFQAAKHNSPCALNFKENGQWQSFSNQDFLEKSFHFACALKEFGWKKNQTLAIFAYQNPFWLIADYGAMLASGVSVPIFHNISEDNLFYQIADSAVSVIFVDEQRLSQKLLDDPQIKQIVLLPHSQNAKNYVQNKKIILFTDFISLGKNAALAKKYTLDEMVRSVEPQDLATIIYTSGSTGKPKGVELTHENLVTQIKATAQRFSLNSKQDKALSFLPLAHVFERMVMSFYITQGIEIYFSDDVKNVPALLQEVNPTLMTVVPRMLEKVFAKIKENVDGANFIKKSLGNLAIKNALEVSTSRIGVIDKNAKTQNYFKKKIKNIFFDFFVYKKFRKAFGKNMRMIICGGAPLYEGLDRFFSNVGINLFCGYGLTESAPVLAVNFAKAKKIGTVGKAFPNVELRVAADGELLARGKNIMRGYHGQAQKTAATIIDGWLYTGDLASIDAEGFVKIIGRKKELFKTANGKYVSPVPIEQKLMQELPFLLGVIIIAENKKFVSALLFPDFDIIRKMKERENFVGNDEEFLHSDFLQNNVKQAILKVNQHLDHAEQIQKFKIIMQKISVESGEITPSMKLKRSLLEEKFKDEIAEFYK